MYSTSSSPQNGHLKGLDARDNRFFLRFMGAFFSEISARSAAPPRDKEYEFEPRFHTLR
jgi:hypothetical protein